MVHQNTKVIRVGYKNGSGLGVGLFIDQESEQVILDNTLDASDCKRNGNTSLGKAISFGELRSHFGWEQ